MKIWSLFVLVCVCGSSGCAVFGGSSGDQNQIPESPTVQPAAELKSETFDESFSKSEFIANDFLNVIVRVPDFIPGRTQFTAALPRTRYGELLMEGIRQAGFAIVLGPSSELPRLSYDIDLPTSDPQNLHTFYVSVGSVHLKRSYEIVDDRIAPASQMLMAGLDFNDLRPMGVGVTSDRGSQSIEPDVGNAGFESSAGSQQPSGLSELKVPYLNRLLSEDTEWNPLGANMYESRSSVYEPLFADSTAQYTELSSRVLVFPNDSLVLGEVNKRYLLELVSQIHAGHDVIRIIGCSHGKTDLDEGNQRLARGRAIRVREELLHAGVDDAAILHEACWADEHFDDMMPRRGVVIMHLRDSNGKG